jgi:hypothetical protein
VGNAVALHHPEDVLDEPAWIAKLDHVRDAGDLRVKTTGTL